MKNVLLLLVLTVFPITAVIFHIWTTIIAFSEGGFIAGVLSFVFPVISELYWMFKMWGVNETYTTVCIIHLIGTVLYGLLGGRVSK